MKCAVPSCKELAGPQMGMCSKHERMVADYLWCNHAMLKAKLSYRRKTATESLLESARQECIQDVLLKLKKGSLVKVEAA